MTKSKGCIRSISELCRQTATIAIALAAVVLAVPVRAQTYTVLYNFGGTSGDGASPYGTLLRDAAGNLFGTTSIGGTSNLGTVFKLDASGTETVLHSFTGGANGDGEVPLSGLIRGESGDFFGTTPQDRSVGLGTVYKINGTTFAESVVYSFSGTDGADPVAAFIRDNAGNLYSTTLDGGAFGYGAVFKLAADGTETVLYSFAGGADGRFAHGLVRDVAGNLYGATEMGGTADYGTVFKVDASGVETVLHSFTGVLDGALPYCNLVRDEAGALYGTTQQGGAFGQGVVFKLALDGTETILHNFTGWRDGGYPFAGVIRDAAGNLYGTTQGGGAFHAGALFKIGPAGREVVLHSFTGGADGGYSYAGLIQDATGNLYGATYDGGTFGQGVIFKLTP